MMTKRNRVVCRPLRIQVGSEVTTPRGIGKVTAVGEYLVNGERVGIVYRVGRNQYWHEWQIKKRSER